MGRTFFPHLVNFVLFPVQRGVVPSNWRCVEQFLATQTTCLAKRSGKPCSFLGREAQSHENTPCIVGQGYQHELKNATCGTKPGRHHQDCTLLGSAEATCAHLMNTQHPHVRMPTRDTQGHKPEYPTFPAQIGKRVHAFVPGLELSVGNDTIHVGLGLEHILVAIQALMVLVGRLHVFVLGKTTPCRGATPALDRHCPNPLLTYLLMGCQLNK